MSLHTTQTVSFSEHTPQIMNTQTETDSEHKIVQPVYMKKTKEIIDFIHEDNQYNEVRICELINEKMNSMYSFDEFRDWFASYLDDITEYHGFDPYIFEEKLKSMNFSNHQYIDWCYEYIEDILYNSDQNDNGSVS
jgi:hypothetical protein